MVPSLSAAITNHLLRVLHKAQLHSSSNNTRDFTKKCHVIWSTFEPSKRQAKVLTTSA
uniref:Uncharacterized protein n=1 Tax=Arion vulgaris TaxID=1028688 RepID=A0A0B7AMN6_9EUPU